MRWNSDDQPFTLPLENSLSIYGVRRVPSQVETPRPVVVFSHGLTASQNDLEYHYGSRALAEEGIESYRFAYYAYEDDARKLRNCTSHTHVADLDQVVRHARSENPDRPVVVVGHSLGGLVALASKERAFDGLVLWDASHSDCWPGARDDPDDESRYEPSLDEYRLRWAYDILVPASYVESFRHIPCDDLATTFQRPLLVAAAGDNVLLPYQQRYFEAAVEPKEYVAIPNADHNFAVGESLDTLLNTTIAWITKHFS